MWHSRNPFTDLGSCRCGRLGPCASRAHDPARCIIAAPTATASMTSGPVGLAHARLSIIDLAGGQQPMRNEDRTVWMVFNGEIFNYVELRADARGARPSLPHAVRHRGHRARCTRSTATASSSTSTASSRSRCGMSRAQRLVLARDRVGIRPLFYCATAARLLFASEVKALFAVPARRRALDPVGLARGLHLLVRRSTPQHRVRRCAVLPPGHVMVRRERQPRPCSATGTGRRAATATIAELPRRSRAARAARAADRRGAPAAARRRAGGRLPVSGGLDSSVIVSLIRSYTDTPLRTFSLAFEDAEFDESALPAAMVRYLGTEHTSVRCTRRGHRRALPAARLARRDADRAHRAGAADAAVAARARAGLQGGADRRRRRRGVRRLRPVQGSARSAASGRAQPQSTLAARAARAPVPLPQAFAGGQRARSRSSFFGQGIERSRRPCLRAPAALDHDAAHLRFFTPATRERAGAAGTRGRRHARDAARGLRALGRTGRDQYVEAHTLLSGYLLSSQGDRVAMANSVEGRVPVPRPPRHRVRRPPARRSSRCAASTRRTCCASARSPDLLPADIIRRAPSSRTARPTARASSTTARPLAYVAELLVAGARCERAAISTRRRGHAWSRSAAHGRAIGFADNMAFVGMLSTMLVHEMFVRRSRPQCRHRSRRGRGCQDRIGSMTTRVH